MTASSAGEGGDTLGEDAGYDTEPDDQDDYAEEEQDPDPYVAHDMLDREFMESGIDAMRRMSRPGVAGGAVGGWGHEQGEWDALALSRARALTHECLRSFGGKRRAQITARERRGRADGGAEPDAAAVGPA